MSSAWAGSARRGSGILSSVDENVFGSWNVVVLEYCSSDYWVGTRADVVLGPDGDLPAFRLQFEGSRIVDALFDALETGLVSDEGQVVLPPIGDARRVLLGGTSSGAHGVVYALDRVAERLPGVEVRGLLDGGVDPDPARFDPAVQAATNEQFASWWDTLFVGLWGGVVDQSCTRAHTGADAWRCIDLWEVPLEHVDTPFFLETDHHNPANLQYYVAVGATPAAYAAANEASMRALAEARPDVGVHASACGTHATLQDRAAFFEVTVDDADGRPWTEHDALAVWTEGAPLVAISGVDGTGSSCRP
jgi:hypothetical protein